MAAPPLRSSSPDYTPSSTFRDAMSEEEYTPASPEYTPGGLAGLHAVNTDDPRSLHGLHAGVAEYRPGSPSWRAASPDYTPSSPTIRAASPSSPEYTPSSPDYTPASPEYRPESTSWWAGSPVYTPSSPTIRAESPHYTHRRHLSTRRVTGVHAFIPDYTPASPEYTPVSSRWRAKSPDHTASSREFSPTYTLRRRLLGARSLQTTPKHAATVASGLRRGVAHLSRHAAAATIRTRGAAPARAPCAPAVSAASSAVFPCMDTRETL
ncbi:hypothetical protein EJB05_06700, partial [Eragrostis curvula]